MASDLISRKALLERLEKIYGTDSIVDKIMLRFLKKLIRKQPTVDDVEVVRCKDCEHYWKNINTKGYDGKCVSVGDDDFCSKGTKMDGVRRNEHKTNNII